MIHINLDKKREKNKIRALSPIAFEEYMATLFREYGYEVIQTPPTNDDGKDLILQYDGRKYYVECKHFTEGAVGREIIQKLVGAGIVDGDVDGFVVATTSYYNDNAIACMEKSNVPLFLLDLDDITSMSINPDKEIIDDLFVIDEDYIYDSLSLKEKMIMAFGNNSDYTTTIDNYDINPKTISKMHHFGGPLIKFAYRFNEGINRTRYTEIAFSLNWDWYFIFQECSFNNYNNTVILYKQHKVALRGTIKNNLIMCKMRDYVFSMADIKENIANWK